MDEVLLPVTRQWSGVLQAGIAGPRRLLAGGGLS